MSAYIGGELGERRRHGALCHVERVHRCHRQERERRIEAASRFALAQPGRLGRYLKVGLAEAAAFAAGNEGTLGCPARAFNITDLDLGEVAHRSFHVARGQPMGQARDRAVLQF